MTGVFHTGITVSNLDKALEFYRDILGFTLETGPTEVFEGDELAEGLGVPGARLRLAVLSVGNGSVELLEYLDPPSPVSSPMPVNTIGAAHVSFRTDNAEKTMEELKSKGVQFLSHLNVVDEGPLNGWKWVYFKDPDGITLELVEYNPPEKD